MPPPLARATSSHVAGSRPRSAAGLPATVLLGLIGVIAASSPCPASAANASSAGSSDRPVTSSTSRCGPSGSGTSTARPTRSAAAYEVHHSSGIGRGAGRPSSPRRGRPGRRSPRRRGAARRGAAARRRRRPTAGARRAAATRSLGAAVARQRRTRHRQTNPAPPGTTGTVRSEERGARAADGCSQRRGTRPRRPRCSGRRPPASSTRRPARPRPRSPAAVDRRARPGRGAPARAASTRRRPRPVGGSGSPGASAAARRRRDRRAADRGGPCAVLARSHTSSSTSPAAAMNGSPLPTRPPLAAIASIDPLRGVGRHRRLGAEEGPSRIGHELVEERRRVGDRLQPARPLEEQADRCGRRAVEGVELGIERNEAAVDAVELVDAALRRERRAPGGRRRPTGRSGRRTANRGSSTARRRPRPGGRSAVRRAARAVSRSSR